MSRNVHIIIGGLGYVGLATRIWLNAIDTDATFIHVDTESAVDQHQLPTRNTKKDLATRVIGDSQLTPIDYLGMVFGYIGAEDTVVIWICLPTDSTAGGLNTNVISECLENLNEQVYLYENVRASLDSIVIRSTLEVRSMSAFTLCMQHELLMKMVHVPEFVRQAHIEIDSVRPSRLVFGFMNPECTPWFARTFDLEHVTVTNPETSAFIKLASNSFLAMKVSFANELANLISHHRLVSEADVFYALEDDKRIGLMHPSIGYGGYCLPKDAACMHAIATHTDAERSPLLCAISESNAIGVHRTVIRMAEYLKGLHNWPNFTKPISILVFGASVSPDNPLEFIHSPTVEILTSLLAALDRYTMGQVRALPVKFYIQGVSDEHIALIQMQFPARFQKHIYPGVDLETATHAMGALIGNLSLEDRHMVSKSWDNYFPGRPIFK